MIQRSNQYDTIINAAKTGDIQQLKTAIAEGFTIDDLNAALLTAAEHGKLDILSCLLFDHNVDVNTTNAQGLTPLMLATLGSHTLAISRLLAHSAPLNAVNPDGDTALMLAARNTTPNSLCWLLKAGADVTVMNKQGHSALTLAIQNDLGENVSLLLRHHKNKLAAQQQDTYRAHMLLAKRMNKEKAVAAFEAYFQDGQTLITAAKNGNLAEVERLLQAGAYVDAVDSHGWTPLLHASRAEHKLFEITRCLVLHGADVNRKVITMANNTNLTAPYYSTPLSLAVTTQSIATIQFLMSHGACHLAADDNNRMTLLMLAAKFRGLGMMMYLMDNGEDISAKDACDWTALMYAMRYQSDQPHMINYLIHRGSDIHATDAQGRSPLLLAAFVANKDYMVTLFKAGAKIDFSKIHLLSKIKETFLLDTLLALITENIDALFFNPLDPAALEALIHETNTNTNNLTGDKTRRKAVRTVIQTYIQQAAEKLKNANGLDELHLIKARMLALHEKLSILQKKPGASKEKNCKTSASRTH